MLLHRHWMWANQVREAFDASLPHSEQMDDAATGMLASRGFGFMFVWYGMLWAVIEACLDKKEGREIVLRGRLLADIRTMENTLRRFRNAVFHVPKNGEYVDERLLELVAQPDSARALRRIHAGFGRLFLEELQHREMTEEEA